MLFVPLSYPRLFISNYPNVKKHKKQSTYVCNMTFFFFPTNMKMLDPF